MPVFLERIKAENTRALEMQRRAENTRALEVEKGREHSCYDWERDGSGLDCFTPDGFILRGPTSVAACSGLRSCLAKRAARCARVRTERLARCARGASADLRHCLHFSWRTRVYRHNHYLLKEKSKLSNRFYKQ